MSQTKNAESMSGSVEASVESATSSYADEGVAAPMVLAGCPQCLMYVMLSKEETQLKCPKCKSPVLLHFHKGGSKNKG
ncbi:hypothetical protein SETIT_6G002700v2 [Setaria italica]|uniref:GIR1-like zinc ribbon domain-containing protein n=1 Tax=Setaria italica TaxID=4555 RepID=A0A368RIA6_SETIT|nr:hypothetical protein SETIT_6G002700v2 [Setaria italica]